MTLLFKSMKPEETRVWIESCNDMCDNCKQPAEDNGLSIDMDDEAINKYQNWKKPDFMDLNMNKDGAKSQLQLVKSHDNLNEKT